MRTCQPSLGGHDRLVDVMRMAWDSFSSIIHTQ